MRSVSGKCCREYHNTHFVFNSCFSDYRSRYGNVEKCNREATDDDNIIRRMRFACWITKATDKYSEYVTLIAFHGNYVYMTAPQFNVYVHFLPISVYPVFRIWQNFEFYSSSFRTLVSLPSSTCCVADVCGIFSS